MSVRFSRPVGNWLLDALPEQEFGRLLDHLQPVSFPLGQVIYEPGEQMDHAYSPTTFSRVGEFQHLLLRYTQGLITQISQTAVCNRLHSIEQRLCRWLLMTHDRTDSDELQMTHEFISNMLGVRREGVTHAAKALQQLGLISHARAHIQVLDRLKLENHVCECYRVVRDEHKRLLSHETNLHAPPNL